MSSGDAPGHRAGAAAVTGGGPYGQLRWHAERTPDRTFAVGVGRDGAVREVSFADLAAQADAFARLLVSLGLGRGDVVHVQLGNVPEFLTCLFGAARCGVVLVPTHPSATVDDLSYLTSHAGATVSVVAAEQVPIIREVAEMVPELTRLYCVGGVAAGAVPLAEACAAVADSAGAEAELPTELPGEQDIQAVLYTSGTTGWPKGVVLTAANLIFAGRATAELVRLRPEDRWLVTLPISHANALLYSTMSALVTGASVVLVESYDPADWPRLARTHGASIGSIFAVHARQVLAGAADLDTGLRLTVFAQHLIAEQRSEFESRFGTRLLQVYGLTETLAPSLADPLYGRVHPDTVGHPTSWVVARLVDEAGGPVPTGTVGQLQIRGEPGRSLMAGYLHRPEDTARAVRGGWLSTGDQMRVEADGSHSFIGRSEEILKPGVDNVSAAEIERVLVEHVSVTEAAVVGVRDDDQENIVGFVVLRAGDDATVEEVLSWAAQRLASYKVPHRLLRIDELPRNAVGKIVKRELRERADR